MVALHTDAAEEARSPETFDPSVDVRGQSISKLAFDLILTILWIDYNSIDLPVFTASARDYVRITKQVRGDG